MEEGKAQSIYFGHPVNFYMGSKFNVHGDKEEQLIKIIESAFPKFTIYNPNQKCNQENYKLWKQKYGNGMKYFFEVVLPERDAGIFLPFEDGMWGKGVFGEAEFLYNQGKPIWEIDLKGRIKSIEKSNFSKCLSVEETRERIYN